MYHNTKLLILSLRMYADLGQSLFMRVCLWIFRLRNIIQHSQRERACHTTAPSTNMMCDESENEWNNK